MERREEKGRRLDFLDVIEVLRNLYTMYFNGHEFSLRGGFEG
jgi:hypothetical protein